MTTLTKTLAAAALVAGGLGLSGAASAAPAGPVPGLAESGLIEHVAQGCGPGFFRGARGFCRPIPGRFYGRPFYRPRYYAPRRFYGPPRFYGPRRFYRY